MQYSTLLKEVSTTRALFAVADEATAEAGALLTERERPGLSALRGGARLVDVHHLVFHTWYPIHEPSTVMTVPSTTPSLTLEAIAEELARALLPENPFSACITACNSVVAARFGEWAEAQRAKVEADFERLRDRDEAPEAWELSALAGAVREWRVFAAFRRLHEEHGCPALLFRLATKDRPPRSL